MNGKISEDLKRIRSIFPTDLSDIVMAQLSDITQSNTDFPSSIIISCYTNLFRVGNNSTNGNLPDYYMDVSPTEQGNLHEQRYYVLLQNLTKILEKVLNRYSQTLVDLSHPLWERLTKQITLPFISIREVT
jgi:hypothetical protein